jgi:phenylacetate-CoA ligase
VRKIIVAGEPGGSLSAVREQLERVWPLAEVLDHYGMTEVGPVAFAKEGHPQELRVLEERYFAEVLNPQTLHPVAEGEVGELVLTPLGRDAWPLFRYRSGDLVRARRDSGGLVLEGGILGRADDMVIVRGVNLYPGAVEQVVRSLFGTQEYRVVVTSSRGLAEVAIEVEDAGMDGARLEAALERAFALRIPVREAAAGSLPRFEMKARRWVRA